MPQTKYNSKLKYKHIKSFESQVSLYFNNIKREFPDVPLTYEQCRDTICHSLGYDNYQELIATGARLAGHPQNPDGRLILFLSERHDRINQGISKLLPSIPLKKLHEISWKTCIENDDAVLLGRNESVN